MLRTPGRSKTGGRGLSKGSDAVRQPPMAQAERRLYPRISKAFAFWIRPVGAPHRTSAWMLNMSVGGAAFLTPVEAAPPIGTRIELLEMQSPDRLVRDDATPLPPFARVLRHDDTDGLTRRVAVRFESDSAARAVSESNRAVRASRSRSRPVRPMPPLSPSCAAAGLASNGPRRYPSAGPRGSASATRSQGPFAD